MITVGSLFSGIGGLELGLERTGGFKTIWFSEIDDYASAVLKKHWPGIQNLGDITKVDWNAIERPDMLTGGFPCQDVSVAGKGGGVREGARSGLWREYAKAIRILRPRFILAENVPMLAKRGLDVVLADLAEMGYDAEWGLLSASAVGAMHKRERIFIFAYTNGGGYIHRESEIKPAEAGKSALSEFESGVHAPDSTGQRRMEYPGQPQEIQQPGTEKLLPSESNDSKLQQPLYGIDKTIASDVNNERGKRLCSGKIPRFPGFSWCENIRSIEDLKRQSGISEPLIRGGDNGVPNRMDRIKCLGNAVVPQVAETIGYWITDWIGRSTER